jgi:hypothetical protein
VVGANDDACALVVVRVVILPALGGGERLLAVGADDDARTLVVVRVILAPALGDGKRFLAVGADDDARALVVARVIVAPALGGGERLLAVGADDGARALVVIRVILGDGLGLDVAPALGSSGRLLAVEAKEEWGFFSLRRLVGTWCPACKIRLANPAVDLGCARGVAAGPKLFETWRVSRPPGAFFPCFFLADVATATAPAAPPSPESIQRIWIEGLMTGGGHGSHFVFY